jgi:hypothetical protein
MISRIAQIVALVLTALVVVYGVAALYAVVFPSGSGEWMPRLILAVYLVNVPIGGFALLLTLAVGEGSPRLRRICIVAALAALILPFLISIAGWALHGSVISLGDIGHFPDNQPSTPPGR